MERKAGWKLNDMPCGYEEVIDYLNKNPTYYLPISFSAPPVLQFFHDPLDYSKIRFDKVPK